jgi:hypothetical protein
MSVAIGAGPRNIIAGTATNSMDGATAWANVRPLDRSAAGAVGEWADLLARISHDLRTPLNAVIGFSDVMQQELFGPLGHVRYQEYVRHIRASGVELLQAAEDALAMTALLAEPKLAVIEDVPLLAVVNEAMDDLTGRFSHIIHAVEIEVSEDIEVRSDRRFLTRAIRQMLTIGLSRAVEGGRIMICAEVQHGLIDLRVEIGSYIGGSVAGASSGFDAGLGRRDLGVWLATALLDLIDCRLAVETGADRLGLRTTLEQTNQPSFFASGEPAMA